MEQWRRKGDCNQDFVRNKSNYCYRKPPFVGRNSNCHPNVPYWEKKFVSSVGSFSWKKFLEAKEFTYLYENILKWDDCAGKEAFHTAKDRFHAKFHGLPCDEQLHDPDLYIDEVDWNAETDNNLIKDLESEQPVAPDDASQHDPVVIFEDVLPDPYKGYSPYGWGDSDDKNKNSWGISDDVKRDENEINWDDYIDNGQIIWDNNCNVGGGNNWWGWNEDNNKAGDQGWNTNVYDDNNYYAYGSVNNKRDMSSQQTWKFHGNNNNNQRRNKGNWRRSSSQRHESQHGHGSTFQARGSQHVRVHQ